MGKFEKPLNKSKRKQTDKKKYPKNMRVITYSYSREENFTRRRTQETFPMGFVGGKKNKKDKDKE